MWRVAACSVVLDGDVIIDRGSHVGDQSFDPPQLNFDIQDEAIGFD